MDMIISVVQGAFWFCLVIGFVAFIHELGHFVAAKLCDVRVDAFAIGMGSKRLWSKTIGETEYSIRALPIGGFVLLAHEDGEDPDDDKPDPGERSFMAKNIFQKIFILVSGPLMNILGTALILMGIFAGFGISRTTLYVTQVFEGKPAAKAGFREGDVIRGIAGKQINDFDDGRWLIKNYAGEEVGVQVERRKLSLFTEPDKFAAALPETFSKGQYVLFKGKAEPELRLFFDRDSVVGALDALGDKASQYNFHLSLDETEKVDLKVVPGVGGTIGIGISPFPLDDVRVKQPILKSAKMAFVGTWNMTLRIFGTLGNMFVSLIKKFKAPEEIGGPVAIANVVSKTAERGFESLILLMAQFCLSIGVFNLIPIPGLDGGRITIILLKDGINFVSRMFTGKEKKVFDDELESYINIFGVAFVLLLLVVITYKDIRTLFGS
jgi:regulator of sigma E protease